MGKEMLKGLGQLGDMAKLMKQAQDMQSKMSDVQKQLESIAEDASNDKSDDGTGLDSDIKIVECTEKWLWNDILSMKQWWFWDAIKMSLFAPLLSHLGSLE